MRVRISGLPPMPDVDLLVARSIDDRRSANYYGEAAMEAYGIASFRAGRDAGLEAAREIYAVLQALLPIVEECRDSGEYSGSEAAKDWPEIDLAKAALARAIGE